jgi:hypothetical protein
MEKNMIEINDNGIKFSIERGCVKNCTDTPDGFSIQLLNGSLILHENTNMPKQTKKAIVNALLTFTKTKKTIINLRDYKTPVQVKA